MATANAPVDPDVRLPDSVRRAAARVEEIYKTPPQDPGELETNQQASSEAEAAGENIRENAGEQQDSSQDKHVPQRVGSVVEERTRARRERAKAASVAKEHVPSSEQAPAEGEAQAQEHIQTRSDRQEDTWERKYNAMKGRFDHANNQLQQLSQQVAGLQNVITTLQQPQAHQEQVTTQQVESMLTQEEREQYGDEFLGVVAKKAHEIVGPLKRELEDKIKHLNSQLGNVNQHVDTAAKDRMFTALDRQIPDWREVNNDPNFVEWLQLPDAYTGAIRHNLLKAAFNQNDSGRVAAFFNGFLAEEAATAPQGQPRNQGAPSQTNGSGTQQTPKTSLETLAAPGRAKSAAAQAPAEKPIFTRAQIAAFYTAIAAGKYEGREKEKDRLEAQIFSAQQEGRIRN